MRQIQFYGIALGLPLACLLAACGGGGGSGGTTGGGAVTLSSIAITPTTTIVAIGKTANFTATGAYSDGSTADLTSQATWASTNIGVGTISTTTGIATGVGVGSTNLTASLNGVTSGTAVLTVGPPLGVFAVSGTNQVTVSWSPVTGATSYNIYWGTSAGITTASTKIAGATSPYLHTGLTAGNTYYYRVSAVNAGGEILSDETFSFLYAGGNPAGLFSAIGSTKAVHPTPTLLPDGTMMLTGGRQIVTTAYLQTAGVERYNPATNLFSVAGSLASARQLHTATLLSNGKILIAGGWESTGGGLATSEIYDTVTGGTSTSSMTIPRYSHTAILLPNGKVLLTQSGTNAEVYDPATGLFSATAGNSGNSATLLPNGKVLIAGGASATAELYDPATDTFYATGTMATASRTSATLLPNGKVLFTGGRDDATGYSVASAELYDPTTGLFSATGSMTTPRTRHTATLLSNGKVLILGGLSNVTASGVYLPSSIYYASAEIYDPATGIFTITGSMAAPRFDHTATLLHNGKVMVSGGLQGWASTVEVFQ